MALQSLDLADLIQKAEVGFLTTQFDPGVCDKDAFAVGSQDHSESLLKVEVARMLVFYR